MRENYEGDMIFKIILDHLTHDGNLNVEEIKAKVLEDRIAISSTSLQTRIDEFKKSQAYKKFASDNPDF
jgi:hypothetical protein